MYACVWFLCWPLCNLVFSHYRIYFHFSFLSIILFYIYLFTYFITIYSLCIPVVALFVIPSHLPSIPDLPANNSNTRVQQWTSQFLLSSRHSLYWIITSTMPKFLALSPSSMFSSVLPPCPGRLTLPYLQQPVPPPFWARLCTNGFYLQPAFLLWNSQGIPPFAIPSLAADFA